ncbi:hypothetical protein EMIT0P265_300002 [Pseudomonas zeae]
MLPQVLEPGINPQRFSDLPESLLHVPAMAWAQMRDALIQSPETLRTLQGK